MEAGLDPDRFWQLTPKQAAAEMKAAVARAKRHQDELAWLAWHVAALTRCETMPALSEFIGTKPRQRGWQEMKSEMLAWTQRVNDNMRQGDGR